MNTEEAITAHTFRPVRLSELQRYQIIGTPAEREFDDVATLAAHIAETPMAYISFIDDTHLWFKAVYGFEGSVIPREDTYCQYVVRDGQPVAIPDTLLEKSRVPKHRDGLGGQIRFYVGVPLRSRDGVVLGTLCTVDIEPRAVPEFLVGMLERLAGQVTAQLEVRRFNRALLEERDTFSTLFEAAPAPLILAERGRIIKTNYAFSGLVTDGDSDSLVGTLLDHYLREVPQQAGEARETELVNELGQTLPVIVSLSRLQRDQRVYDLVTVTDITDRLEKERVYREQRAAAENANRIKDTFLSLVSHDLRSPLSGISMVLELLDQSGESFTAEERGEMIRDLREATAILVEMINQLLNIHRLKSGTLEVQLEAVDVATIARQVVLSLGKQIKDKQLSIVIEVPDGLTLQADMALFREALFNLVSNAIKFSFNGGRVIIRSAEGRVSVEDNGTGVPEKDRPDLFRHEVKTSRPGTSGERGTGLGLPLVSDIMVAHGGKIRLDDDYHEGARFVLDFEPTCGG